MPRQRHITCALALVALGFTPPSAGRAQVPEGLRTAIAELGVDLALERTLALYRPLLAAAPTNGVVATKDFRYGPDPT